MDRSAVRPTNSCSILYLLFSVILSLTQDLPSTGFIHKNYAMLFGESSRTYYVYIITNVLVTALYIGVTNNLLRRMFEHRTGAKEGFSKRYHLTRLVYFEETDDIGAAIHREKQLKNWHREWKLDLFRSVNPRL